MCERLRAAEGTPAIWSRVTLAGAILSPAAGTTSGAFIVGAALLADAVSPEVARFAIASNFYAVVASGALSGIAMTRAALVILKTGVFPRWLGWAGALIAAAAFLGSHPASMSVHDDSALTKYTLVCVHPESQDNRCRARSSTASHPEPNVDVTWLVTRTSVGSACGTQWPATLRRQ
jgi:hypothetical protein